MAKNNDPAFLFYSQDFIVGTLAMTFEERGKYITLLCYQHQAGHMSLETIRFLVGLVSDNLLSKFEIDNDGKYYNERLDIEINKRNKFYESRTKNGLKGGRPKKEIKKPYGKPKENHSEDEDEDVNNILIIQNNTIYDFENFWNDYDKKVGDKKKIEKKFNSISESDKSLIKEHIPKYKESQPEKQFRKNPETYINQKSWNDEIIYLHGNSNIQQTATSGNSTTQKNTAGFTSKNNRAELERAKFLCEAVLENS
jgi:hypothetical protein